MIESNSPMIAALYVQKDGAYFNVPGIDPWDEERDARKYDGPWPVIAHPPCNRWTIMGYVLQKNPWFKIGDDGGCFEAALKAVRKYGGVLEHPARTIAWKHHGLLKPSRGGWTRQLFDQGWVCEVDQGNYGHICNKWTWLYAVGCKVESFNWSLSKETTHRVGRLRAGNGNASTKITLQNNPRDNAIASKTPDLFKQELIRLARSVPKIPVPSPIGEIVLQSPAWPSPLLTSVKPPSA